MVETKTAKRKTRLKMQQKYIGVLFNPAQIIGVFMIITGVTQNQVTSPLYWIEVFVGILFIVLPMINLERELQWKKM